MTIPAHVFIGLNPHGKMCVLEKFYIGSKIKEEQPILIGYLNKEFGFANHLPVKEGTKVYLHKDRYFFNAKSFGGLDDKMTFYKETLHNAIDFI